MWFPRKKISQTILKTVREPESLMAPAILDGDETAATPVEGQDLGKLARIQPFSPVAISLIRLFSRENADTHEVVRLVQSDAALAAETLAYVNSALFSLGERVTDLHHAITMLGAELTRSLATTLAMRSLLQCAAKPGIVRRLWRHSIATAILSRELAAIYGISPDLAHTAGILHDLGRFGLLAQHGDEYGRLVLSLYDTVDLILQAERELCGMDHCEAGAYLARAWKFPEVFQQVAADHHLAKGQRSVTGLVHTACAMADDLTFAAVCHCGVLKWEERVADCVPRGLRQQVRLRCVGAEERIRENVEALDF